MNLWPEWTESRTAMCSIAKEAAAMHIRNSLDFQKILYIKWNG
jgi:hypothetical protein